MRVARGRGADWRRIEYVSICVRHGEIFAAFGGTACGGGAGGGGGWGRGAGAGAGSSGVPFERAKLSNPAIPSHVMEISRGVRAVTCEASADFDVFKHQIDF